MPLKVCQVTLLKTKMAAIEWPKISSTAKDADLQNLYLSTTYAACKIFLAAPKSMHLNVEKMQI